MVLTAASVHGQLQNPTRDVAWYSGVPAADYMVARIDSTARRVLWKSYDGSTIAAQAVAAGGLSAAIIIPSLHQSKGNEGLGGAFVVLGTGLAAAVVIPVGVYFVGQLMGGDGSYGTTLLGGLIGGGVGLLPAITSGTGSYEGVFPVAVIGAAIGSVVGYHIGASPVYDSGNQSVNLPPTPGRNVQVTVVSIRI